MTESSAPRPAARPVRAFALVGLGALLVVVVLAVAWLYVGSARVTEQQVQTAVLTTLQREAPQEFLVTGELTSSATATGRSRRIIRALDIPIGQTRVRVEIPGRMTYGFDLGDLGPEDIRFDPEGIVEVRLPRLQVQAVEAILEDATVDVQAAGTDRLGTEAVRSTVERSFREVRPALRRQAEGHLADADQPRINTARALQRMLSTPLEAAGVVAPRFRFLLAPGDTLELGGGDTEGSRRVLTNPPAESP